jgi:hypothetical protein
MRERRAPAWGAVVHCVQRYRQLAEEDRGDPGAGGCPNQEHLLMGKRGSTWMSPYKGLSYLPFAH